MIFVTLANAFYSIFSMLLSFINIPAFPVEFTNNVNSFLDMLLTNGMTLITFFIPNLIISVGIPLVLVLFFAERLYAQVMWIIRKIPILGMS